jgi:signal transduction histidine kinase
MSTSSSQDVISYVNKRNSFLYRWIYPLAAGFMFAAVFLRAVLVFQGTPLLSETVIILLILPFIFLASTLLAHKCPWVSVLLIGLEMLGIVSLILLTSSIHSDFFAFLFAIIGMQIMQQYTPKVTAIVIGLSALLIFFGLLPPIGFFQALALTIAYTAINAFMVAYIGSTRRASAIQERQLALSEELKEANIQLDRYSQQVQQLAAGRERQRLARELHDSVTQTIFSMTLAAQSARLFLSRDRTQVGSQLNRIDYLAQHALSEMQALITQPTPENRIGGFLDVLQQHLAERKRADNLCVKLEVAGDQSLTPAEEASLFRIAQEALNNVVKHAQATTVALRLHLVEPFWMVIEDQGAGFDPQQARKSGQVGIAGMRERAAEIGWGFEIESAPGQGTRIRVEKERKDHDSRP